MEENRICSDQVSRREFIRNSASTAISLAGLSAGGGGMYAAGQERLRVGLVGCGGRGTGALRNIVAAAKQVDLALEVHCLADALPQRVQEVSQEFQVPPERCFGGFDAYRKVLQSDIHIVLLVTPPAFRPLHFEAAVQAGKHVFMEKPVAVDPVGARRMLKAGESADQQGLSVVAGTQRRHHRAFLKNKFLVDAGAIGRIVGGSVWWCGGALWYKNRLADDSVADYLVKNWVSFTEMSGDHIVEQHVHNLDVANWFIGRTPETALGFGARWRRQTGNQYDCFSIDYDYGEGCRIHSMCRQISGCYDRIGEEFLGSLGSITGEGKVSGGQSVTAPEFPGHDDPYVQEHIDLLKSIIAGKSLNETQSVTESTLTGLMGRISAYSGDVVRWSDLTSNPDSKWYNLALSPAAEDFETGTVTLPQESVASVPGVADGSI